MNSEDANKWKADVLSNILLALATSKELKDVLVYKGALILNMRLGTHRMSLDIDSNLLQGFTLSFPESEKQQEFLNKEFTSCISRFFDRQDPVRYKLTSVKIQKSPPKIDHPLGWDAFAVKINVIDFKNINVRALPPLTIDVAAPETLSDNSISELDLGGYSVKAYTLERIAGEKLRAFLSTLPAYRAKVSKPGEVVRVKDLYDLARIHRVKPIEDNSFWDVVGDEFKLACESRYIDCDGLFTFKENWEGTKSSFISSPILPKDVDFEEAEEVITKIATFLSSNEIVPFRFDLPD